MPNRKPTLFRVKLDGFSVKDRAAFASIMDSVVEQCRAQLTSRALNCALNSSHPDGVEALELNKAAGSYQAFKDLADFARRGSRPPRGIKLAR